MKAKGSLVFMRIVRPLTRPSLSAKHAEKAGVQQRLNSRRPIAAGVK